MARDGYGTICSHEDWLVSASPEEMIRLLDGANLPLRLWQLFACACCWRVLPLLDDRSRYAVGTAERCAEGLAGEEEVKDARHLAHAAVVTIWRPGVEPALAFAAMAAHYAIGNPRRAAYFAAKAAGSGEADERRAQAGLLRDIFESPFAVKSFNPSWHNPSVQAVAADIYENETFAEMPVLADALEEAGCLDVEMLEHARQDGPHVRGCWLIDRLLTRR